MKKIPTIFVRDFESHKLTPVADPRCHWVFRGEGIATRKHDGSPILIDGTDEMKHVYKRYELKPNTSAPVGWAMTDRDEVTGKMVGWLPVGTGPEDKYFREAIENFETLHGRYPENGTYEACGPKINGNPEDLTLHMLIRHGSVLAHPPTPIEFGTMRQYLGALAWEGIVWHHPDGRMAKIKGKDFGIKRA